MTGLEKLKQAIADEKICRVYLKRGKDGDSYIDGHIYAYSDTLFLMNSISDTIYYDSFIVMVGKDPVDVQISPRHECYTKALKLRGQTRPKPPEIDLSSMSAAINSIADSDAIPFIVVSIRDDEDVCWVGQVLKCDAKRLRLQEVNADAVYDAKPTTYAVSDITRVCFDGSYEEALWLVNQSNEE